MGKPNRISIRAYFSLVPYIYILFNCLPLVVYSQSSTFLDDSEGRVECSINDFEFHYTQCNAHGERWRYAIPKSYKLNCRNSPPPVPGLNCSFSCPAGNYFDLKNQKCFQCQPGTYSLGDGVRYEQLLKMPSGFSVENFPDQTDQLFTDDPKTQLECSDQIGWVIQNGELRYLPTPCVSKLSISLNLVHDGYIQFYYKMPKNSRSLFSVLQVRNAFCQSYGDSRNVLEAPHSSSLLSNEMLSNGVFDDDTLSKDSQQQDSELRIRRLHVRAGQNLVTWTVANNRDRTTLADIIYVSKIDIFGLAFTPICSPCLAGTYSQRGAQHCEICPSGTYSHKGFSECKKCLLNEYSGPKAEKCLIRPPCQSFDYFEQRSSKCSANGTKQSVQRKAVEPNVCQNNDIIDNRPFEKDCLPCRLGMERNLRTGECEYCKNGEYSYNGLECKNCPENTMPDYGYYFTQWDVLPREIKTQCEYLFAGQEECNFETTWITHGDRIESAQTRALGVVLGLSVEIEKGFFNPLRMGGMNAAPSLENPIAQVSLEIEMLCGDENCQLYFVQERKNTSITNRFNIIASFNGTQKRSSFTYPIYESYPTRFLLAFMRAGIEVEEDSINNRAILYSLNITHIGDPISKRFGGGGRQCVFCPMKDPITKECRSCPPGHYLNKSNNVCIKCPYGTALNLTSLREGIESCIKCGPNLGSDDGTACSFSGRFKLSNLLGDDTDNKTVEFDISELKNKVLTAEGIRIFAREGNSYYHSFNISIFDKPVQCRDTFDSWSSLTKSHASTMPIDSSNYIPFETNDAVFCRSTAIPSPIATSLKNLNGSLKNDSSKSTTAHPNNIFFVSSTVTSRRIGAITQDRSFKSFYLSNDQLEYDSSLSSSVRPTDVHIFYEPLSTRLPNCPQGIIGVVTLRCELSVVSNPVVRLSRKCPDGTCDGCLYHVIVESASACPICHSDDYQEIRGECIGNLQKIHYIPSKHCVLSGAQTHERTEHCSSISKNVFFLLLFAALVIACLVIVILVIYEKNKSLEYRYMRIVEGKELDDDDPTASSCALESEEEEDDNFNEDSSRTRVFFKKKKNNYIVSLNKNKNSGAGNTNELADFLSDNSDED